MITLALVVVAFIVMVALAIIDDNRGDGYGCLGIIVCILVMAGGFWMGISCSDITTKTEPVTTNLMLLDNGKYVSLNILNDNDKEPSRVLMLKTANNELLTFPAFKEKDGLHVKWYKTDKQPKVVLHYSKPTNISRLLGFAMYTQTYYDVYYSGETPLSLTDLNPLERKR